MEVKYSYASCSSNCWFLKATINGSCFGCHRRSPLLWLIDLDLYVFVETTFFSNLILSIHFSTDSYEPEISYSTFNVPCFWFHVRFPILRFTYLDVYVFFEPTFFSNLMLSIHVQLIPMNMRFPTPLSTCCVFDFMCFPWLWLTDFDLYVFFEFAIFQKSIVSYESANPALRVVDRAWHKNTYWISIWK